MSLDRLSIAFCAGVDLITHLLSVIKFYIKRKAAQMYCFH
jgi:hypothetical protein